MKGVPPQSATFSRLSEARSWAASTEAAIISGRYFLDSEADDHSVAEVIRRYREEVLPDKAWNTQRPQMQQLDWWESRLGRYSLRMCTSAVIARAVRDGLSDRAPPTVNRYLAVISHVFSVAVREWRLLHSNPVTSVRRGREARGRTRFLSSDERTRLLAACQDSAHPWLHAVVVLALSTGMRHGELMGLTWGQVDLAAGRIVLRETKNGDMRAVPLTGLALDLLRQHKRTCRQDTPLVWPGRGSPPRPVVLRKHWVAALEAAGIDDFRFHDLRHSACAYLLMSGATLSELAEVMGHKTLQMVKRYSHITDQHAADLVGRMNASIFDQKS